MYFVAFQSTQVASDSVADDWNKLVDSCVRSLHYNALALKHARKGDYSTAARIWLRASRGGFCDGKILFNLAICYQNGLGMRKDITKVICNNTLHIIHQHPSLSLYHNCNSTMIRLRLYHDTFDYDGSDQSYSMHSIRL